MPSASSPKKANQENPHISSIIHDVFYTLGSNSASQQPFMRAKYFETVSQQFHHHFIITFITHRFIPITS